nr:dihydroorotate dehydrogenase (quinone), mitochondrial [Quercus suber]
MFDEQVHRRIRKEGRYETMTFGSWIHKEPDCVRITSELATARTNNSFALRQLVAGMHRLQALSGVAAHSFRPMSGHKRTQWRTFERQWCRHLFSRNHTSSVCRPTSTVRISRPRLRNQSTAANAADAAETAAATTKNVAATTKNAASRTGWGIVNWLYATGLVALTGFGYMYITDTRASIHQWLVVPLLRVTHVDPEDAHHTGVRYVKGLYNFGLHPRERGNDDEKFGDLKVEVFGHVLDNPLGTSAGIDKDAEIPDPLFALGPAIVEVGGVTPLPQEGNAKPRVFRIPSQNALINRYGLNSQGAAHVAMQLRERVRQFAFDNGLGLGPESERIVLDGDADVPPGSLVPGKLLAVQVAKNKSTPDGDIAAIARDYVTCVQQLGAYADILVVNVSSPNTPGLRDLQATAPLTAILSAVVDAAKAIDRKTKPAVMVKVSPDEDSESQVNGICSAVWNSGVDGVIVGNTTKKRPDPIPKGYIMPAKEEKLLTQMGGYSGPQMFERTLALVGRYRSKLDSWSPASASPSSQPTGDSESTISNSKRSDSELSPAESSTARDAERLKPLTAEAAQDSKQPLLAIPDRHSSPTLQSPTTATPPSDNGSAESKKSLLEPKVIFATGGITTGDQCLQVLNAGASVCQVYTAMMYGGVGTITRMKNEMRKSLKSQSSEPEK